MKMDCVYPKEYKIARSHSLTTSKSPSKPIYISIYPDEPLLCPFTTLSSLLERTEFWRISDDQKSCIFLITTGPHTPAATCTIAGWIKSIIEQSSPSSTAKDMRVTSAFLLQNSGADIAAILALGNWSSNTTYQRFYQRGVRLMLEKNKTSSTVLSEAIGADFVSSQ